MVDQAERQGLLDDLRRRFGVELFWHKTFPLHVYRDDVTVHTYFSLDRPITPDLERDVRRWVEERGWQYSRQPAPLYKGDPDPTPYILLAPEVRVPLAAGYHATRRASLPSIFRQGLLDSTPERQTTDRGDPEGNVYLCENLGSPADAGVRGTKSAHWWRAHLADVNRFGDRDWVILRVAVGDLKAGRLCRDLWSESGVVLDHVPAVPPDLLRLEYSAQ